MRLTVERVHVYLYACMSVPAHLSEGDFFFFFLTLITVDVFSLFFFFTCAQTLHLNTVLKLNSGLTAVEN